ncbi:unnamed protein product [Peniophora sp. CBMAI 1063]|nr:unnamed protein product [Peniophora sp. CBMAI 1063]
MDEDVLANFTAHVASDFSGPRPYPALVIPSEASPATDGSNLAAFRQGGIYAPAPAAKSPRRAEVKMSTSSPSTPGASSLASVSPPSIAALRTPTDIVPNYQVKVAGDEPDVRHHERSHSMHEPESLVPSTQDPYLIGEQAGERANTILGAPGSRKHVPSPTMRSKLQVSRDMFAYATRTNFCDGQHDPSVSYVLHLVVLAVLHIHPIDASGKFL